MTKFNNKFDDTKDCKLWVTSDLHLNHNREFVWEARGYKSPEDHTNGLIDTINQICRPKDILLNLGDSCLNTRWEDFESLFSRIKCRQLWLKGNHNNPWEKNYQNLSYLIAEHGVNNKSNIFLNKTFGVEVLGLKPWIASYVDVTILGTSLELVWNGQNVCFNHYPYLVWNDMGHGSWSCCGHSHYTCESTKSTNLVSKQLDCGWDGHGKPLCFSELKLIMDKKKIYQVDHHNKETN